MASSTRDPVQLLDEAIADSGLPVSVFADTVLHVTYRTIARWRSGESPIPRHIVRWLENPTRSPWPNWRAKPCLRQDGCGESIVRRGNFCPCGTDGVHDHCELCGGLL